MSEDAIYKIMSIRFRKEEDKELIQALEDAVASGGSKRATIRDWFYLKPEIPNDLCSIRDVDQLLMTFKIPYRTRITIIEALKKGR